MRSLRFLCALCASAVIFAAQLPTPLWLRGYSVIPTPRSVQLATGDITLDDTWAATGPEGIALTTLRRDLALRGASGKTVRLSVQPGTVATRAAPEVYAQAYRLRIDDQSIEVTGNGAAGLFYGVQTLLQLARRDPAGRLLLPKGTIEDWPALQLRFLHWDAQQHQDRIETLKRYLDWAARFKVNMVAFQLEDKFEFPSHPVIGVPGAYTTAQLQEIVDYGLQRHIQVAPLIQAPAHFSWALKHPEFAELRADGNNYQACLCDPRSFELIFSLYDDVIRATRGVDYLFASTDEVYYAGIDARCSQPYNPVNRSLRWVEFVQRAHEFLTRRGRKMLIWAEYPLLAEHVKLLPSGIIDGVIGEPEFIQPENERGIRQMAYTSMQGVELLFPDHFRLESVPGRLESAFQTMASGKHRQGNPIGAFGAAWDASGLHNETFWLGWSAVAQWAWNPGAASVDQHVAEFMNLYYGPRATGMAEIYRSLQRLARFWEQTWDRVPSRVRGPAYGNSYGKGIGVQRYDLTLSTPRPDLPDMSVSSFFAEKYRSFLATARSCALENDQLIEAIQAHFAKVDRNHYNLEVLLSLATFIRHHWRLLTGLADAEASLKQAESTALKDEATQAVGHMVASYNAVERLEQECDQVLKELTAVFEKSRYPRGRSLGGKKFLDVNDDTKDYWAQRRPDMTYLIAPEQSIRLPEWRKQLAQVIQAYAKQYKVPVKGLGAARLEE